MIKEDVKLKGQIHLVLRDENNQVKYEFKEPQMVMNVAKAAMAALLGTGTQKVAAIGLGTTNTAEAATQLHLAAEVTGGTNARIATSYVVQTTTTTDDSAQFEAVFPAGNGTASLVEAGLFSDDMQGAVTFQVAADTVTLASHGIPDGTPVYFSAISTTTGISIDTKYFVRDTAANTFKLALTVGGAAIDLTGADGTGTLSAGIMFARKTFGVITKGASDSLTITWKIQVA